MRVSPYTWILLALMFAVAFATGCTHSTTIPDFRANITLPASGDGYWVKTVSQTEGRVPAAQWALESRSGIILLSADWKILRGFLLENCLMQECKLVVGTFDSLFQAIDQALGKIPASLISSTPLTADKIIPRPTLTPASLPLGLPQ